ncbi:MAG: rhomboid family intramembrane serine protease [Flavobacteriales bacterium]
MEAPPPAIDHGRRRLVTALIPPGAAVAVLAIVFAFDRIYHLDLYRYSVWPRSLPGLFGILVSPFVHGSFDHLANNCAAILVLGWLLVYFYPKAAWRVVLASWLTGGAWVWVAARESHHIGASGIVYGLAAFLFFSGVIRRRVALMTVSLIVVFLYGSMWWGVLPLVPGISWESHLFGGLAGAIMAWVYRNVPPAHVPPPIVLEDGPDEPAERSPVTIVYDIRPSDGEADEQPPAPPEQERPDGADYDPFRTSSTFPWE